MSRVKLAVAAAMKAKKAWDRLPPEQRKKLADTARTQGQIVAKQAVKTARTHGPAVARRIADAIEKARKGA
jgi:hypothetical protein